MIKVDKLLILIFILGLSINFSRIVFAEGNKDGVNLRHVVEYNSGNLRDPFNDLFQLSKEENKQNIPVPQESAEQDIEQEKIMSSLNNFKVQGVIWGGNFPQAIINNKIFKVGDLIDGFEIVDMDKEGISLSFSGAEVVVLPTPGNAFAIDKKDKEENKAKEEE